MHGEELSQFLKEQESHNILSVKYKILNELVESLCEQIFLKRYISTTTSQLHYVFDLHCILASFVQSLDLTSSPTSYFMECLPNFKQCLPFSRSIIMIIG